MGKHAAAVIGVALVLCALLFAACSSQPTPAPTTTTPPESCQNQTVRPLWSCNPIGLTCPGCGLDCTCVCTSQDDAGWWMRGKCNTATCPPSSDVFANDECMSTLPACSADWACGAGSHVAPGQCTCINGTWSCTPDVPCDTDASINDATSDTNDASDAGDAD